MRANAERLDQLRQLAILDSSPEKIYDDLTKLLVRSLDVPIGMVNLLDTERDWFKACVGLPMSQSPADASFCEVFFNTATDIVVVEDTSKDPRFATHPFVAGAPFVRFYAAARLTVGQQTVGTLCVYDTKPHQLSEGQMLDLQILAEAAIHVLESRKLPSALATGALRSIVLMDSDPDSSRALSELICLVEPGCTIDVRRDWPSAMTAVLSTRPWAVIADLKMAGLDSLAPVASIRAVLGDAAPIMVAVAADISKLDALELGYDFVFGKPVEIASLMSAIGR
ncbi:GAF domain-containing protein [Variovorax sp. LG9.2]|jgi:CheY-like chemotaxis protein|uniref:GAF domain-containing protein n=1 Tax=Variovorax sp. LG9.2 TaxID=3048626 RepID=UPI002B22FA2A|nr:GAF domain-containing protein [Variovorax sp. LG9.2]MEB0059908.1 GAF domain-containing protein [Variovorax sp. LG9.2]